MVDQHQPFRPDMERRTNASLPAFDENALRVMLADRNLADIASLYNGEARREFERIAQISREARAITLTWIEELHPKLSAELGFQVELLITGSHIAGTFSGPKETRNFSRGGRFVEVDIFCLLPDRVDPHDSLLVEKVKAITGFEAPRLISSELTDPGREVRQLLLYGYPTGDDERLEGTPVELELNFLPSSNIRSVDPSRYWHELFSAEERVWIRECRKIGRDTCSLPYDAAGGVKALKQFQLQWARGRLLARFALEDRTDAVPAAIARAVPRWREHFEPQLPSFNFDLPLKPPAPPWVHKLLRIPLQ